MTLTIEIPDEAADLVRASAELRGVDLNTFAVSAVLYVAAEDSDSGGEDAEPDPDAVEGIRRGLEDLAAGRTISFESYVAEVAAKRAQRDAAHNPV